MYAGFPLLSAGLGLFMGHGVWDSEVEAGKGKQVL